MQRVVLLLSFLAIVFGQNNHNNNNNNQDRNLQIFEFPPNAPRLIEVDGISLTKNNVTKTTDAVQFFFNTLGETTLQFNYYTSSQNVKNGNNYGPQNTVATQFAIAFRAFDVFEFDNNDGVPGFQETTGANKDTITGLYDLSSLFLQWNPITVQQQVVNGQNVTSVTAQTQDNVFLIKLLFSGQPLQVGAAQITPNQVKVDFAIRWFNNSLNVKSPFSTGPSNATAHPNAEVGLFAVTAAEDSSFSHINGSNSASLTFKTSNFSASFQYANNVTVVVDGIEKDAQVHVSIEDTTNQNVPMDWTSTWTEKISFFSFEGARPSYVYWDPILGSDNGQTSSTTTPSSSSDAQSVSIAVFLIFALLFFAL